ncbi:hypothetical protein [Clostridium sp.]|uniref:hypothetical protein n=1 Tax=Clostridium sp. TaxID=1506 RepID=UPI00261342E7|nr:hypothetical protein [Clostridium sp.]
MSLKLPFPEFLANTSIEVFQTGTNTDGDYEEAKIYEGKCIYTDKSKQVLNAERQLITISGRATIKGDINPGKIIEGYVIVSGAKKSIYNTERPTNPDGSVFSTEVILS